MTRMYFSGIDSESINTNDYIRQCIRINPELYDRVYYNQERSARIFLDTHLLRIRSEDQRASSNNLVYKSRASIDVGRNPFMSILIYTSVLMLTADLRKMSSDEFRDRYLSPLDNKISESNIVSRLLVEEYRYPFEDVMNREHDIQQYFDRAISETIERLYRDIGDMHHYFNKPSIVKTPLDRRIIVEPDIIHMKKRSDFGIQCPYIVFGIGDYKAEDYQMTEGFEELKAAIEDMLNQRLLRSQLHGNFFPDNEWSPRVLFALVLRKYIYQALLCGTDRILISDHQTFSGFFKYNIMNGKMTIDYYIINDPETVEHGITLRSAIAGFFYKSEMDATNTRNIMMETFKIARKTEDSDPFENVLPKDSYNSSGKWSHRGPRSKKLDPVTEKQDSDNFDAIDGNTYCRIIYDSSEFYPDLSLPSPVFTKLYYYSRRYWKENDLMYLHIPEKRDYYRMFYNELAINEIIASSQFASNFPKLLVSGYWNGLPDHPMHIFEYLGREIPEEKWNKKKVYQIIKSRLDELHRLGISHNDIRIPNIHVSESGKVILIDFGLSDSSNNETRKKDDFDSLDLILGRYGTSEKEYDTKRGRPKSDVILDYNGNYNDGSDSNWSSEEVFDTSAQSFNTSTTK